MSELSSRRTASFIAVATLTEEAPAVSRLILFAATAADAEKFAPPSPVSTIAILLSGGRFSKRFEAISRTSSSLVRFSCRNNIRGAVSTTHATATGPSWSTIQPVPRRTGRESARTRIQRARTRTSKRSKCCSFNRRFFMCDRACRNRSAGNRWGTGLRRIRRCSSTGIATTAIPLSNTMFRKERPIISIVLAEEWACLPRLAADD